MNEMNRASPIPPDPNTHQQQRPSTALPLRGPISNDPGMNPDSARSSRPHSAKPHIRPEALKIARSHQGKELAYLFNPAFQVIPIGVRSTRKECRDYNKENFRKIKQIQRANRDKQQVESNRNTPVRVVHDKYQHVQSKVKLNSSRTPEQSARPMRRTRSVPTLDLSDSPPDQTMLKYQKIAINEQKKKTNANIKPEQRPNSANNNIEKQKTSVKTNEKVNRSNSFHMNSKRPFSAKNNNSEKTKNNDIKRASSAAHVRHQSKNGQSSTKITAPREETADKTLQSSRWGSNEEIPADEKKIVQQRPKSGTKNHVAENKASLKNIKLRRSPSLNALEDLKQRKEKEVQEHRKGSIPKYLEDRRREWKHAEEERIANLPDPTVPEGHTLMPDTQRVQTLNKLRKSQKEHLDELQKLPVSRDTLRVRSRRDAIEKKLQDVDNAIKIFSRPRVFIKEE